jgi:hypothetical protein
MMKIAHYAFILFALAGFLLMIGVAGADCDGKCMENALPIVETIQYALMGLAMMAIGAWGAMVTYED